LQAAAILDDRARRQAEADALAAENRRLVLEEATAALERSLITTDVNAIRELLGRATELGVDGAVLERAAQRIAQLDNEIRNRQTDLLQQRGGADNPINLDDRRNELKRAVDNLSARDAARRVARQRRAEEEGRDDGAGGSSSGGAGSSGGGSQGSSG
jgi:glycosyltransferase involved in cell wall biosynthesis